MPEAGKYGIVYADPPWRYDMKRGNGVAENHYPNITLFDRAFDTLKMFQESGALAGTMIRGFGERWEQPLSDIFTDMREPGQKPSVRRQLKKQPEAKASRQKTNHQQER